MSNFTLFLKDHVTCSVCLETYTNPQILRCLHTFCLKCIEKIKSKLNKCVVCPECRIITFNNDYKHDFKTQNLIDFSIAKERSEAEQTQHEKNMLKKPEARNGVPHCEVCMKQDSNEIICRCVNCDQFMCLNCKEIHNKVRGCTNHKLSTIDEELTSTKLVMKNIIEILNDEKKIIDEKRGKIVNSISNVQANQLKKMDETNVTIDKLVNDLHVFRDQIHKGLIDQTKQISSEISGVQSQYENANSDLEQKIKILTQQLDSTEIHSVTKTLYEKGSNLDEYLKVMRTSLPPMPSDTSKPILDIEINTSVMKNIINIKATTSLKGLVPIFPRSINFSELLVNKYKVAVTKKLEIMPMRICLIADQIWTAGGICAANSINIFHKIDLSLVKSIKNITKNAKTVFAMTQSPSGDVIVACGQNLGLKLISRVQASYIRQIAGGSFADVCIFNDDLYAFDFAMKKVLIYTSADLEDNWKLMRSLNVGSSIKQGSCYDRMAVHTSGIYISSWIHCKMCKFSFQGACQSVRLCDEGVCQSVPVCEEGVTLSATQFTPAIGLCSVDYKGNVLVAKQDKVGVLEYHTPEGATNIFHFPCEVMSPYDAVVDNGCNNIWVAGNGTKELLRFTKC